MKSKNKIKEIKQLAWIENAMYRVANETRLDYVKTSFLFYSADFNLCKCHLWTRKQRFLVFITNRDVCAICHVNK